MASEYDEDMWNAQYRTDVEHATITTRTAKKLVEKLFKTGNWIHGQGVDCAIQQPACAIRLQLSLGKWPCAACGAKHRMLVVQRIVMETRGAGEGARLIRELHLAGMRHYIPGIMLQAVMTTAGMALAQSVGMVLDPYGNSWVMC